MSGEGYSTSEPGLRTDGPTIEEYVRAGYRAVTYPPVGYQEKPSAGLDAFKVWQRDPYDPIKRAEAAEALGVSVGELIHGKVVVDETVAEPAVPEGVPGTQVTEPPGGVSPEGAIQDAVLPSMTDAPPILDTPHVPSEAEAADLGRPAESADDEQPL